LDPLARIQSYLEWLIAHPVAELSRAQRFLRFSVDLVRHCSRELRQNDAAQVAAALTYRTMFGLVPLLMVSMLAFRLFGDMQTAARHLQSAAYAFFNYEVDPSRPEAAAFKHALDERLLDLMTSVSELSFEAIGAVGALLLIWAALGLLISLEHAANRIYRAPRGRGWPARIGIYWSVLTLGPILLLVVLYAAEFWLGRAEVLPVVGPLFALLSEFGSLFGGFLALTLLYKLMPNTHVRWRPAFWGAFVAAVLSEVSKWGFGLYVSQALPYLRLYGAIGLVPLFLFWLYLGWLIILFGLQIASTLQAMKGRVFERRVSRGSFAAADPHWLLPVMVALARRAPDGQPVSLQQLAEDVDLRLDAVGEITACLEADGLVHQVSRHGSAVGLTLALPPERVAIARLLELASRSTLGTRARTGPGWAALGAILANAQSVAGDKTLADVL
jgi:membrane protein